MCLTKALGFDFLDSDVLLSARHWTPRTRIDLPVSPQYAAFVPGFLTWTGTTVSS